MVVNNAYMKSEVYQKAKRYLRFQKIAVIYTGQVGATVQGAIVVGTDATTYTPWPISEKVVPNSGAFLEWDFGQDGVPVTLDAVIASVNVLVLTLSLYAATDDLDIHVHGVFK